jgi:hypothetical protein
MAMKSLFHPPSVLFGCDQVCFVDIKEEVAADSKVVSESFKPSIKMFIPLEMPFAHEPVSPERVAKFID